MNKFVSVKAYGDFVIALNAISNFGSPDDILLCGDHLRPLSNALKSNVNTIWLGTIERDMPALFDCRKNGFINALKSLYFIRHKLLSTSDYDDYLIFDSMGVRQFMVSLGRNVKFLSKSSPNIYINYQNFFNSNFSSDLEKLKIKKTNYTVCIFPDSRLSYKAIKKDVLLTISKYLGSKNIEYNIVFVAKDRYFHGAHHRSIVIEGFDKLVDIINQHDVIISSDSLPAHIAELFSKPVFVLSPIENQYWLPRSSFDFSWHSTFDNLNKLFHFLEQIKR